MRALWFCILFLPAGVVLAQAPPLISDRTYTLTSNPLGPAVDSVIILFDGVLQPDCGPDAPIPGSCILAGIISYDVTAIVELGAVFTIIAYGCNTLGICGEGSATVSVDPTAPPFPDGLRIESVPGPPL